MSKLLRVVNGGRSRRGVRRDERGIFPHRLAVFAPVYADGPARQRFARIPLALAVEDQGAGGKALLEPPRQLLGERPFFQRQCGDVPFQPLHVVDGHKCRFTALCQTHVACNEFGIYLFAEAVDVRPLDWRIRLGDARVFMDAGDRHGEIKLCFARIDCADDGCGAGRRRRAGERNVAFAGQQSGGRIEANPARARYVGLSPRMQIGKVMGRPGRAIERLDIGSELNKIARDETRGHAAVAQQLHQQPAAVAARSTGQRECLLAGLHARFHPHQVFYFMG